MAKAKGKEEKEEDKKAGKGKLPKGFVPFGKKGAKKPGKPKK